MDVHDLQYNGSNSGDNILSAIAQHRAKFTKQGNPNGKYSNVTGANCGGIEFLSQQNANPSK